MRCTAGGAQGVNIAIWLTPSEAALLVEFSCRAIAELRYCGSAGNALAGRMESAAHARIAGEVARNGDVGAVHCLAWR